MIYIKTRSRRYIDVFLRDTHGLNALDRLKLNECCSNIKVIKDLMKALRKKGDTQRYGKIKALLKLEVFNLLRIVVVDVPDRPKMRQWVKGHTFVSMEAHLCCIKYWCICERKIPLSILRPTPKTPRRILLSHWIN